ncbi:RNA ligase RtcB family protein [Magnetococcales bacterium HHB-1]
MDNVTVVATAKSWIEGTAHAQLQQTAKKPGMLKVVGMPDLHPGNGYPVGASFLSQKIIYPALVGSDIGCGMSLWQTDIRFRQFKIARALKKLTGLDRTWSGDLEAWLKRYHLTRTDFDDRLGTVGSGNHFAELQRIEKVIDKTRFDQLSLAKDRLFLLVHSGSRGLGESIWRRYGYENGHIGLRVDSDRGEAYLEQHDRAVTWGRANRALVAERIFARLSCEGELILDSVHNSVTPTPSIMPEEKSGWLHRKGSVSVVESDETPSSCLIIPGSRGSFSYLVAPKKITEETLYTLPHGAGRKWKRSECRARLSKRFSKAQLTRTALNSRVICEDHDLLFEEAPQAYKKIESVIDDLQQHGLISVIAILRPVITYKKRRHHL